MQVLIATIVVLFAAWSLGRRIFRTVRSATGSAPYASPCGQCGQCANAKPATEGKTLISISSVTKH